MSRAVPAACDHVGMPVVARPVTGSHHLYIHMPFCRLVCAYCDFVTVGGRAHDIPRYVMALRAEMALRPAPGRLATIYLGGGTPSLLPASAVDELITTAMDRWVGDPTEITLEANPSGREAPDWRGLHAAGVNRISLGAQSLRDADLRSLARGHTAREVQAAFRAARAAGFDNLSLDLIYGIPGQTLRSWRSVLRQALRLAPEHLSLYALQLAMAPDEWAAPPRPGALRWRRRVAASQDDGLAAAQYAVAEEVLEAAGYRHYELSSWALPGRESRHNSAYWDRRPYTGIGAGAHSFDGRSRSWNVRDLDAYLEAVANGVRPAAGSEALDEPTAAFEALALGLRRVEGVSRRAFIREFGADPVARYGPALAGSVAGGLLIVDADRLSLTPAGRLLASEVLIGLLPGAADVASA
jgi:oxygen-independent coproporphyrinogen-3 oxidase